MAYLSAAIIFALSFLLAVFIVFAASMSSNPAASKDTMKSALKVVIVGSLIYLITLFIHWMI